MNVIYTFDLTSVKARIDYACGPVFAKAPYAYSVAGTEQGLTLTITNRTTCRQAVAVIYQTDFSDVCDTGKLAKLLGDMKAGVDKS